ncbi:MAG TPA: hypothetical protein VLA45_03910, partial [Paracoccaceae bacterium]|nr:hypothetical protein [Paracoccaceae bacterium]
RTQIRLQKVLKSHGAPAAATGEGHGGHPGLSMGLSLALIAVFAAAAWVSLGWRPNARLFPLSVSLVALAVLVALVATAYARMRAEAGEVRPSLQPVVGSLVFVVAIGVLIGAAVLVGQPLALALFALVYLLAYARVSLVTAMLYTGVLYAFVTLFYGKLLNISWLLPMLPVPQF